MSMREVIATEAAEHREQKRSTFSRSVVTSAGAILAITGIAKLWSGLGHVKLLVVADPILGIQFGHLMFAVGLAAIVIALVCFSAKRKLWPFGWWRGWPLTLCSIASVCGGSDGSARVVAWATSRTPCTCRPRWRILS